MRYCVKFSETLGQFVINDTKSPPDELAIAVPVLWEGDDREQAMTECQRLNRGLGNKYRKGARGER